MDPGRWAKEGDLIQQPVHLVAEGEGLCRVVGHFHLVQVPVRGRDEGEVADVVLWEGPVVADPQEHV
jgi:hypothetical protein